MKNLVAIVTTSLMLSLNAFAADNCATLKADFEAAKADFAVQTEIIRSNTNWDDSVSAENCQLIREFEGIMTSFETVLETTGNALVAYQNSCELTDEENKITGQTDMLLGLSEMFSGLVGMISYNCSEAGL